MTHRLAICLGLLLGLPMLALPCWIVLNSSDAVLPDLGGLRTPPSADVVHGENGFVYFDAAAKLAQVPEGEQWQRLNAFRSGESSDDEWISRWVHRNAKAIDLLRSGLASPGFAFPSTGIPPLTPIVHQPPRSTAHRPVDAPVARSRARLGPPARVGPMDRRGLGRHLGCRICIRCVVRHRCRARPGGPHRLLESAGAPEWLEPFLPDRYLWQPNRTLSLLAAFYRDQQRKSATFCTAPQMQQGGEPSDVDPSLTFLAPNAVGRWIVDVASPNLDRFQTKRCHSEAMISPAQAFIAAKAYRESGSRLPARLDDLVPAYLDGVPADPFGGAPLRYSPSRAIVYSIGEDFTDSSGGAIPDFHDRAEPALSLAFQPWRTRGT